MHSAPLSSFSNMNVSLAELPTIEQLQWHALSPRYMPINLAINLVSAVLVTLVWLFLRTLEWEPEHLFWLKWLGGGLSALSFLYSFYAIFADRRKAYALREQDLSFRSGLWSQQVVTQPIARIQHIELKQGAIERSAGLATLQVFSAGGASYAFEIPGLPLEQAQTLRQFILNNQAIQYGG